MDLSRPVPSRLVLSRPDLLCPLLSCLVLVLVFVLVLVLVLVSVLVMVLVVVVDVVVVLPRFTWGYWGDRCVAGRLVVESSRKPGATAAGIARE